MVRGIIRRTASSDGGNALVIGGWTVPHPSLLAVLLVIGLGGIAHVIGVCFLGFGTDSAPLQQVTEYDELNRKLLAGGSASLTGSAGRRPSQPSLQ